MDLLAESDALHARAQRFIDSSLAGRAGESFDTLALALARFQAARVAPFARLVRARGVDLERARDASAIPALPAEAWRMARVAAHPPALDVRVFRTSGTTSSPEARGEHAFRELATYARGALGFGRRMLFPDEALRRAFVLAPPPAESRDSSLGFMLDLFAGALPGGGEWFLRDERLDVDALALACARARAADEPVLVLGASFAFVHLLDARGAACLTLPPKSRAMQTGGFKGRSREVAPSELRAAIADAFAMPPSHVVGEYGMTELSSQAYEGTLSAALGQGRPVEHGVYFPPPWLRIGAASPETLEPLPDGEIGIARFVDLASVDSAVAVQTADLVRVLDGGAVELLGRLPGATPRGCSLAIDALLLGASR